MDSAGRLGWYRHCVPSQLLSRFMTMTTCACGLQAVGQCTRCQRPVCWAHAVHGGAKTDWQTPADYVEKVRHVATFFGDRLACLECLEQAEREQAAKPRWMPDLSDPLAALKYLVHDQPAYLKEAAIAAIEEAGGMNSLADRLAAMARLRFPAEHFRGRKRQDGSLTAHVICSGRTDNFSGSSDDWRPVQSWSTRLAVDDMNAWWRIKENRSAWGSFFWGWSRVEIAAADPVQYGRRLYFTYNLIVSPPVSELEHGAWWA